MRKSVSVTEVLKDKLKPKGIVVSEVEASIQQVDQTLNSEERLEAVLYQFISLYERWSEDRQVAAKQGANAAKLVQYFTEQVKNFEQLESGVKRSIIESIREVSKSVGKQISDAALQVAAEQIDRTVKELQFSAKNAQSVLESYKREVISTQWKVICATVGATIATCSLLVWLVIPKPVIPLTDKQIEVLRSGQLMNLVWPKLSKKEQEHWLKLANEVNGSK